MYKNIPKNLIVHIYCFIFNYKNLSTLQTYIYNSSLNRNIKNNFPFILYNPFYSQLRI